MRRVEAAVQLKVQSQVTPVEQFVTERMRSPDWFDILVSGANAEIRAKTRGEQFSGGWKTKHFFCSNLHCITTQSKLIFRKLATFKAGWTTAARVQLW